MPLRIPFCALSKINGEACLSCMNAIIYDVSGRGKLTVYSLFGRSVFKKGDPLPPTIKKVERLKSVVTEAEKEAKLVRAKLLATKPGPKAEAVGPEAVGVEAVTKAGIFGGGNTMLIVLGLGVVALIGGIMFFGKKKRKKAVSYG